MKKSNTSCSDYRPISEFSTSTGSFLSPSCEHCAYYSSRNCHHDISDIADFDYDIF